MILRISHFRRWVSSSSGIDDSLDGGGRRANAESARDWVSGKSRCTRALAARGYKERKVDAVEPTLGPPADAFPFGTFTFRNDVSAEGEAILRAT